MKYSITKEDFTVTLMVNTNTGSCYSETQFIIMVIKREEIRFFFFLLKINESVGCHSVSVPCGEEGASSEGFEIAAGTGCASTAGKQLEKHHSRAWAGLCRGCCSEPGWALLWGCDVVFPGLSRSPLGNSLALLALLRARGAPDPSLRKPPGVGGPILLRDTQL